MHICYIKTIQGKSIRMARKKEIPKSFFATIGSSWVIIQNAGNIVRWNPNLAIDLMETVLNRIHSPIDIRNWNRTAKRMNDTIDDIESTRYYSKKTYWGINTSIRLELQEIEYSLEDYFAMQQFLAEDSSC